MVLYINIIYNIGEKIKKLDKNVKQILGLSSVVLILFAGTVILKTISKEKAFNWDYSVTKITTSYFDDDIIDNDRKTYWELKSIITDFVSTMADDEMENSNKTTKKNNYLEYYDVISKRYKKYLNKDEYAKRSQVFINKFLEEDHIGHKFVCDFVIESVYKYGSNMYLCIVVNEYNMNEGYIGIQLDKLQSEFSIFYLE